MKEINDERAEYINQHLVYNPETGIFIWAVKPYKSRVIVGRQAGSDKGTSDGYRYIFLKGERFPEHRLAFFFMDGAYPPSGLQVDHINHIRDDNRWSNLRLVTASENSRNRTLSASNTSGINGVRLTCYNTYRASYTVNGKSIEIGSFKTIEEATEAREKANKQLGFHPNHGLSDIPPAIDCFIGSEPVKGYGNKLTWDVPYHTKKPKDNLVSILDPEPEDDWMDTSSGGQCDLSDGCEPCQ